MTNRLHPLMHQVSIVRLASVAVFAILATGCNGDTDPASSVTPNAATLNGHGASTSGNADHYFEYGLTTSYGQQTAIETSTGLNPSVTYAISANVTELLPSKTYHFRLCGKEHDDPSYRCGNDRAFTTTIFTNPLQNSGDTGNSGDPSVILDGGFYWRVQSSLDIPVKLYKSTDLVNWTEVADILTTLNVPPTMILGNGLSLWAPEIHKVGAQYILAITGEYRLAGMPRSRQGIYVGAAAQIAGPYNMQAEPLVRDVDETYIDGHVFVDGDADRTPWLLWKRDNNIAGTFTNDTEIQLRQLTPDGLDWATTGCHIAGCAKRVLLTTAVDTKAYEQSFAGRYSEEGPWLVKFDGQYHLFFAAGAVGYGLNYSLGVAIGSSLATGAFTKEPQPLLAETNGGGPFNSYGHGAVVQDAYGGFWFLFAGWLDNDPNCLADPTSGFCGLGRKLMLQKMRYDWTTRKFGFDHPSAIAGPADVPPQGQHAQLKSVNVALIRGSGAGSINGTLPLAGTVKGDPDESFDDFHFTTVSAADVPAITVAQYDTVVLYQVLSDELTTDGKSALSTFLTEGGKLLIHDSDGTDGNDYAWLPEPAQTGTSCVNCGLTSGTVVVVENNTLVSTETTDAHHYVPVEELENVTDSIGDANVMTTQSGAWFVDIIATNGLGEMGAVHTYATVPGGGLIIFNGFDHDPIGVPLASGIDSLGKLWYLELAQGWNPDQLPHGRPVAGLRYNEVQQKASHNSYERHEEIGDQLVYHRIRSLEFDIHDDDGDFNWRVYHEHPGFPINDGTSCYRLSDCLDEVAAFHRANPNHEVITLVIELKDNFSSRHQPIDLDGLIGKHIDLDSIFQPTDLLASCPGAPDLQSAVTAETCGWPSLFSLRGKVLVVIMALGDGADDLLAAYAPDPTIAASRVGFIMSDPFIDGVQRDIHVNPSQIFFQLDFTEVGLSSTIHDAGFVTRVGSVSTEDDWNKVVSSHGNLIVTDKVNVEQDPWATTANAMGWPFQPLNGSTPDVAEDTNAISVRTSSGDIWHRADNFAFLYERNSDPGTVSWTASISTVNSHVADWAKACLMARSEDSLGSGIASTGAPYFAVCRPADNHGPVVQWRFRQGSTTQQRSMNLVDHNTVDKESVMFVKLAIEPSDGHSTCATGYGSSDGLTWKAIARHCVSGRLTLQGLAASSHGDTPVTFVYTNVTRTGSDGVDTLYKFGTFDPGLRPVGDVAFEDAGDGFLP